MTSIDAREHLLTLVGKTLTTLSSRRPNRILSVDQYEVLVAAERSPSGTPVPVEWVQAAIDRLLVDGEITVDVETLGYRSAFVGVVLATLPGAVVVDSTPKRVRLTERA